MSAPRTKRQFAGAASDPAQRQITSFFSKTSSLTSSHNSPTKTCTPLNGPVLPAQIQSNLINVGMRVRKAVPEGYKTGNQYSAFKLWEDDPIPAPTASSITSTPESGMRELLPFCGIHKVGGMDVQPVASVAPATADEFDDPMSIPGLTNSQESVLSHISISSAMEATQRAANGNGKRRFSDAGEEDGLWSVAHGGPFRLNTEVSWFDAEISPRSLAPDAGWENNGRVLAVPKRRQSSRKSGVIAVAEVGQENVKVVPDGNDFDEASFLVDDEMDMEY
ncbi:ribonucleotide reductase inhibitor-domain-containing protein [Cladorrhinum sp. PSN259]|nr:ribonucleotide reductase inhibitor-domain-containing protein [Cladorrhinum sp. PSN259]